MRVSSPLKIAIVGTNNDKIYSGGRYHALILAYALARAGAAVTFISNKHPKFEKDLEPLAPRAVTFLVTPDFRQGMPEQHFDYVIVVPTGIYQPHFYEATLDFARRAEARVGLINFESGNWFNEVAPTPRDVRLWNYWRRVVTNGGLVISSLRVSDGYARDFYTASVPGALRFEVCGPPINSLAADRARGVAKDGSVIAFVRSKDAHKGGEDLLRIDPAVLAGRKLRIIAGGDHDPDFRQALEQHFQPAGVKLEFRSAISDVAKFNFIAQAQALLFPSRFEGFGYPPVEAAYMGVEVVCYDLPALRETVGPVAHMAPIGDTDALAAALAAALDMPERREELWAQVADLVDIDAVACRIMDILLRSRDAVPTLSPVGGLVLWGPFDDQDQDPAVRILPYVPATLQSFCRTRSGQYLLSVRLSVPEIPVSVRLEGSDATLNDVCLTVCDKQGGEYGILITARLSALPQADEQLGLSLSRGQFGTFRTFPLRLVEPTIAEDATLRMTGLWRDGEGSIATFDVEQADSALISCNGRDWVSASVENGKMEVPLAEPEPHKSGMAVYLFKGGQTVEFLSGCPPMTGAESADDLADAQRNCTLEIFRQTDAHWERGILRNPGPHYGAVIGCIKPARTPEVGDILRLRSGRLITICKVEERGKFIHLSTIEGMNSQSDGFPNVMIVVSPADLQCDMGDGGSAWDAGVWQGEGPYAGRCIVLPDQVIADCGDEIDQLSFIRSDGSEVQVEKIWSRGGRRIAWLRERAGPNADPKSFAPSSAGLRVASRENIGTAEPPEAWREADRAGRVVFFEAQARLSPGQAIVFGGHDLRHVLAQQAGARGTWVLLNMAVARSERKVRFATAEERAHFAARQLRHRSPIGLTAPGKLGRLIESYRRSQPIVPMSPLDDRPRVLFTSIVPPDPADQGNRIVTRNFIKHILTLGFDVDLLLIGAVASERIFREFGDRVRVFSWPFPDWASEPSVAARLRIAKELREAPHASSGADYFRALLREASTYHPFFIVPDPLIRTARALYCKHDYQAIVCNYTHMIRVACELEPIRPLPPVAIVTHDALSRLPLDFEGTPIDTGYRLCSAEIERDVLNAVPGALVLAISKSEQHYFREIGVSNPIELCEYDGLQECDRYRVMPAAFAGKRLLFHASGNPMNKVAIDWFLQNCWATVRRAVPDAKLVICGKISAMVDASIPGLEVHGVISRNRLMEILGTSTLAINPTLVGTGLKIKTVEACCAGLPSVCLPAAIEGLEDVASRFCALEEEPDGFAAACIRLLTDPDHWKAMRDSSLAFAAERFSEATIYGPVDRYLGWHEGIEMRHARLRLPYEPDEPRPLRDLVDGLPEVGREMKQLLLSLLDLGEIAMAASILAKLHDGALPGDVALCNAAVEFALASDNLQMARHAALSAIATDPADLSALVQLLWVALRTNDIPLANETWDYLSLAAPGSRGTAEFAKSHGLERWQAQAAQWAPFPLDCRISGFNWVSDFVPIYGRLGPGWSPMESWGAWSDGPYARLNLRFESRGARLKFRINGTAQIQGVEGERIVRILADSKSVGQFSLPLDAPTCQMEFDIAAADLTVQGELVIEFLIQNPGPARHEDSSFSDGRLLGFALQSIEIDEVSEAIEAAA